MIERWELSQAPLQSDPLRCKVRLHALQEDLEPLAQRLALSCARPFPTLAKDFNWAFYLPALPERQRSRVIEVLQTLSPHGGIRGEIPAAPAVEEARAKAAPPPAPTVQGPDPSEQLKSSALASGATFAAFAVGACNRFACAAAKVIAEHPGKSYNPFWIHGPAGGGKSHLAQALVRDTLARRSGARTLYMEARPFLAVVQQCLDARRVNPLRERVRALDLFVLEDLQSAPAPQAAQEEFAFLLKELLDAGRQVVLTADRPSKFAALLNERAQSLIEGGLAAALRAPDAEICAALVAGRCRALGLEMDPAWTALIVERAEGSLRKAEGLLKKIHAYVSLTGEKIDEEFMESLSGDEQFLEAIAEPEGSKPPVEVARREPPPPPPAEKKPEEPPAAAAPAPAPAAAQPAFTSAPQPISRPQESAKPAPEANPAPRAEPEPLPEEAGSVPDLALVCFHPENARAEFDKALSKLQATVRKYKLKFKPVAAADKPYPAGKLDETFFLAACQAGPWTQALLLGPAPAAGNAGEFARRLPAALAKAGISCHLVGWEDLDKDANYLSLALELSLSARAQKPKAFVAGQEAA